MQCFEVAFVAMAVAKCVALGILWLNACSHDEQVDEANKLYKAFKQIWGQFHIAA